MRCLLENAQNQTEKVIKNCYRLEFKKIAGATAIGFLVIGFIGFFVKLIHIPINNILLGGK